MHLDNTKYNQTIDNYGAPADGNAVTRSGVDVTLPTFANFIADKPFVIKVYLNC